MDVIILFENFDYIEQFYYGFIIKNRDTMLAHFKIFIHSSIYYWLV